MFSALRFRDFRFVLLTLVLSQAGYWGCNIAFQSVLTEVDGTPATMGALFFCLLVPFTLFSIPAGVLADAFDRRRLQIGVLLATSALAGVCAATVAARVVDLPVLLVLAFLAGTGISFLSPVTQALVANTVPAEALGNAVPIQAAGLNLARSIGPAVAGLILVAWGPLGTFVMYATLSLAAVAAAVAVRTRRVPPVTPVVRESLAVQVRAGIRHARERPPAALCLVIVGVNAFFGCTFTTQLAIRATSTSDHPDTVFPILVALTGLGSFLGVLVVARLSGRVATVWHAAATLGLLAMSTALLGAATTVPVLAGAALLCGSFSIGAMVILQTVVQRVVDDAQRGRAMSLYFLGWGGMPFGALLLGGLSTWFGSATAFLLYAAACLATAITVIVRLRRGGTAPLPAT
ncbi:MFS transporter [Micromonospora sp. DSM 115977]|uniref:MFS transporter n=1 Tax=Micromonospora reichwaldensis TaxID=3075516 RepID=A0ABU2WPU0_9ACTN|nr:MFS transporter [Micromonospora sp. DSM 115977]MDT0527926.1 MFS transporter [Micromonospora sp. DSM 115977]